MSHASAARCKWSLRKIKLIYFPSQITHTIHKKKKKFRFAKKIKSLGKIKKRPNISERYCVYPYQHSLVHISKSQQMKELSTES